MLRKSTKYFFFQIDKNYEYPKLHVLCYIINWFAVLINPIIYVMTQERYRVAIIMLFKRMVTWKDPQRFQCEMSRVLKTQSHVKIYTPPNSTSTNQMSP